MAPAWKCAKTSPRTLATKERITTTHRLTLPFSPGVFYHEQHDCCLPPILLSSVSLIEDENEISQFWHNWGDRSRQCWTPSQNTTYRMHLKNGRSAGNGAKAREGITPRWPVDPKLVFYQMAAPVPEIMDDSFHTCIVSRRQRLDVAIGSNRIGSTWRRDRIQFPKCRALNMGQDDG
jgi:hypothetical protein